MKRLSTVSLLPGMVLAKDITGNDGIKILARGTELTENTILKLELYGIMSVYVEDTNVDIPAPTTQEEATYLQRVRRSQEFIEFQKNYETALDNYKVAMNDVVEKNIPLSVDSILREIMILSLSVQSSVSTLLILQNMREYDDSTFTHSLNVALLCNLFATWLHFSQEEIELATACGLFHDIGKLMVPNEILTKPAKLTEHEFKQIKKHPADGYQILKRQNTDINIQNAALMHHERMDGSGYPLGLSGEQINKYARLVAIADVYDAMTAKRVYRGPLCPFRVIEVFEEEGIQKYDLQYLMVILENVVNTYLQCKCKLSDGREGNIIFINKEHFSRPVVQCNDNYVDLFNNNLIVSELL